MPARTRVLALDALRGFDMFWIVGGDSLVRAWADWSGGAAATRAADQMTHVEWNGFHFYDLIFPLFVFVSGAALPFSLLRRLEQGADRTRLLLTLARRSLILVVLGIVYNNVDTEAGLLPSALSQVRYPSVLGRIGLANLGAGIIIVFTGTRGRIRWLIGLLVGYWAALQLIPVPGYGRGQLTAEGSLVGYIDRALLPGHLFLDIHDPEGLLSTVPAIGTALIGALCGQLLRHPERTRESKVRWLAAAGLGALAAGWVWGLAFPVNKNLWTSSFVLITAGWSILLLALFFYLLDVKEWRRWAYGFVVIGSNPILIYLANRLIDFGRIVDLVLGRPLGALSDPQAAVGYWIAILALEWLLLWVLYRRRLLFKI